MFKKFLAAMATLLLAAGLSVVAVAAPASATHPTVTGTVACNPTTGQFDITWRVTGDAAYPNAKGTIKTQSLATSPTLVDQTVQGTGYVEAVQKNVAPGNYELTVGVKWNTHAGVVTQKSNTVKVTGDCAPAPTDSVDCSVIKFVKGSPLDGSNYINLTLIQDGVSFQMNAEINEVQAQDAAVDGPTHLYVLVHTPGGDVKYPLTVAERDSGIFTYSYSSYLTGVWTVDWIQYDGHNEHFEGELACGTPLVDAAASVSLTPATCDAPEQLVLGGVTNATWGVVTGAYSVTATAKAGHKFPAGDGVAVDGSTKTFTGTLDPQLTGDECADPEPECIPASAVHYTYFPWSNSGTIYVDDVEGSTHELCDPFWVTATSWKFLSDTQWPQKQFEKQDLYIDKFGEYPFAAPIECGQGDVYASFEAQPQPTEYLFGPDNPFEEQFLHEMGFDGPAPTFNPGKPGCNVVEPVVPTVTTITECGTYGSVVANDTAELDYTITGNGGQGVYTVTVTAKDGFVLKSGATTEWEFDLGTYEDCPVDYDPKASVELGGCYPEGDLSYKNVTFAFDNLGSDVPVTFTVPTTDDTNNQGETPDGSITVTVPAHAVSAAIATTPISYTGGSYEVFADGVLLDTLALPAFDQCQDDLIPADPKANPEVCEAGVVSDGSIWVDLMPGKLQYTIHGGPNNIELLVTEAYTTLPAGDYTVSVEGINGFNVGGTTEWPYSISILEPEHCELIPTPVVLTSAIECDADGTFTLPDVDGVLWYVNDVLVADPLPYVGQVTTASTVVVKAKPADDTYGFESGEAELTFELNFAAPEPCADAAAFIETVPATCLVAGSINQDTLFLANATWDGELPTEAGTHSVTATALPNHVFPGGSTTKVLEYTIQSILTGEACDPPTLAIVTPTYSTTPLTCTAAGSYTLGEIDPGTIAWTVNGEAKPVGTYAVTTPGELTLVAAPINPEDGLDEDWENPVVLTFAASIEDCDLPTLAFTGATTGLGLMLAGGMLFVGLAGIYVARRRHEAKAQA